MASPKDRLELFSSDEDDFALSERQQTALDLIHGAWMDASHVGVEDNILINTALYAALTKLVDMHGEDAVSEFCAELCARVLEGEFTRFRVLN